MKKYRVEAFIIPVNVNDPNVTNRIDDEKLAIKLKDESFHEKDNVDAELDLKSNDNAISKKEDSLESRNNDEIDQEKNDESSDMSGIFFDVDEHIYDEIKVVKQIDFKIEKNNIVKEEDNKINNMNYSKVFFKIEEPIYDEPFVGNLTSIKKNPNFNNNKKNNNNDYDVPQNNRWTLANSKYRRFGVVAPKIPKRSSSLQSISEDVVEGLVDETIQELCCHGRKNGCQPGNQRPEDISDDIFKENWMQRLDALRKLETLLKDKEVALQSRERLLFKKEKELRILERLVKDKMKQAELYAKRHKKALSAESVSCDAESKSLDDKHHRRNHHYRRSMQLGGSSTNSKDSLDVRDEKVLLKNPPNSMSSLNNGSDDKIGSLRSRSRPKHRTRYDDLDSTLSADVGDSSFIVTSKKFDPVIFKKPLAFTRSASERRPRSEQLVLNNKSEPDVTTLAVPSCLEEKTLKKISDNIIATQNQESKLFNYGLIDGGNGESLESLEKKDQKKFSYLNLDAINKTIKLKVKPKDRPVSWSEDTDDWLKKKRQAYNMSTKNVTIDNNNITNEKENFDRSKKMNKSTKIAKKKDGNLKRFSIFR